MVSPTIMAGLTIMAGPTIMACTDLGAALPPVEQDVGGRRLKNVQRIDRMDMAVIKIVPVIVVGHFAAGRVVTTSEACNIISRKAYDFDIQAKGTY